MFGDPFRSPKSTIRPFQSCTAWYCNGNITRTRAFVLTYLGRISAEKLMMHGAVGGSITAGQGARYGMPYMKRIWDWIEDVSPNANHYLKHAAFGGSTSGPHGVLALAILNLAVGDTL